MTLQPVITAMAANGPAAGLDGDRPIGVFDSGVGGLSVLRALHAELAHERFVYFADAANAPYGERGDEYVAARTMAVARELIEGHAIKALVVACNTATAAAIHLLRAQWPDLPVIGVEPALKPAVAKSRTGRIAVLATRGTLQSDKFRRLHESLAGAAEFRAVPCDGLAGVIERGDTAATEELCARYMRQAGPFGLEPGAVDTVVLGCTHYPFASWSLRRHAPADVQFIDTGVPVALHVRRLLAARGQLREGMSDPSGHVPALLLSSGDSALLRAAAGRWLAAARTRTCPGDKEAGTPALAQPAPRRT